MNVYKLGLLTRDEYLMNLLLKQLNDTFGDHLKIEPQYYNNNPDATLFKSKVVLVSSPNVEKEARKLQIIPSDATILYLHRIIINPDNVDSIQALLRLKKGTQVVIGTNESLVASELVSSFLDVGIEHLEFFASYPNGPKVPASAEVAVVFGHPHLAPPGMKQVIDMGMRYISMQTILEIVQTLKIKANDINLTFSKYIKMIIGIVYDLVKSQEVIAYRERMLQSVIAVSGNGLLVLDGNKKILYYNEKALEFLGTEKTLLGQSFFNYVPQIEGIINNKNVNHDDLININGQHFMLSITVVELSEKSLGYVVVLYKRESIERLESHVRQKLYGKVFKAKHTFDDILTQSREIAVLKDFSFKAAQSNCNIVISGESGTGKELYAQAIHNASHQKNEPFVPANVAALQDTLIESELFGYEEGAFTGAKKGGKPGIFELAHNGTIFLDEIGELSWPMQSKLLRVLQEREIMRLGGTKIIPVNVRIIVATNRNLRTMVDEGKFRSDLYFRLHVLPINIPPLRDRPEDVELLAEYFLSKLGVSIACIPSNVISYLKNYSWPGNVRELENLCNFIPFIRDFCNSDNEKMEQKIFEYIGRSNNTIAISSSVRMLEAEKVEHHRYRRDFEAILSELDKAYENNESMSRVKLYDRLNGIIGLTEPQIRTRLKLLSELGMVASGNTKQGSMITEAGRKYLKDKY